VKFIKPVFFTCAFFILLLSACSDKNENNNDNASSNNTDNMDNINESGMPIVKDSITLEFFAGKSPSTAEDWNDVLVWNEYEDRTNIHIDWKMIPFDSLEEKRTVELSSNDYPDAFYNALLPIKDVYKFGQQGVFIDLSDLIEEHAPNLQKILEENPSFKSAMTFPDGNIYSLPLFMDPDNPNIRIAEHFWIREDWLETLDMEMPETTDEFYQYLKAVKEENPSGNGENDEVPFGGNGVGGLVNQLEGAWGLGNRGIANGGHVDIDPETDELRFIPTDPKYKELLEFINKLYSEELIEQNIYSIEYDQYMANASQGKYGSVSSVNPEAIEGVEEYTGAIPLEGPHGDQTFNRVFNPVTGIGSFTITDQNEHPIETIKWMDYFYGDEGMKLQFLGVEGKTFEEDSNGELQFIDEITDNPEGLTFDQAVAQYLTYPGGGHPGFMKKEYNRASENQSAAVEAMDKAEPYLVDELWPDFTYTDEEYKELETFQTDMNSYIDEMQAKFITGDVPFSEWDNYVAELEKIGSEEYLEIQEAALNRYIEGAE